MGKEALKRPLTQAFGARAVHMNDDCILCISQTNLLFIIIINHIQLVCSYLSVLINSIKLQKR